MTSDIVKVMGRLKTTIFNSSITLITFQFLVGNASEKPVNQN